MHLHFRIQGGRICKKHERVLVRARSGRITVAPRRPEDARSELRDATSPQLDEDSHFCIQWHPRTWHPITVLPGSAPWPYRATRPPRRAESPELNSVAP